MNGVARNVRFDLRGRDQIPFVKRSWDRPRRKDALALDS
jgi:hypothetical protein